VRDLPPSAHVLLLMGPRASGTPAERRAPAMLQLPTPRPPGSLVCIGVGQHAVVNAAGALAALPVPWHRGLVWRETRESQFCPEFLFKKVRYLSFPRYSTKIYFLQPKPPTNILAVRDSQEDTPLRRATYSEFPPSSLCADHGLRKSETRAFTHTNQFVRSWLFLTCFM
jgi:hypothetical protein